MRTNVVVGFMVVIAATGCKTTVDHAEVEKSIKEAMAEKKLALTTVTCPAEIVRKEGDTFTCTAVDDAGTDGNVKVTWKEGGNFTMNPEPVMTLSAAGDAAEGGLTANIGKKVDVKCPEKVMFLKAGKKFTCDATVEGLGDIAHKVDFTLKDDKGGLDMKLHPASEAAKLRAGIAPARGSRPRGYRFLSRRATGLHIPAPRRSRTRCRQRPTSAATRGWVWSGRCLRLALPPSHSGVPAKPPGAPVKTRPPRDRGVLMPQRCGGRSGDLFDRRDRPRVIGEARTALNSVQSTNAAKGISVAPSLGRRGGCLFLWWGTGRR